MRLAALAAVGAAWMTCFDEEFTFHQCCFTTEAHGEAVAARYSPRIPLHGIARGSPGWPGDAGTWREFACEHLSEPRSGMELRTERGSYHVTVYRKLMPTQSLPSVQSLIQ